MSTTQPRGGQILDNSVKLDAPNQDVTGILPVANGGTGSASQTLNTVLLGNGTGALQNVAPGASGNVLTSNGTTWASAAPAAGGAAVQTTKGDLAGFSTVAARVPVGPDGNVLVADSGQALGLAYQNIGFLNRRNAQFSANPGAITVSQFGFLAAPTITAAATTTNGDGVNGSQILLNTAATAGSISNIATAYTQFRRDWLPDVSFRLVTSASGLTAYRAWCGLMSAAPGASNAPLTHYAAFRYIGTGAGSSAFWQLSTAAGTATQTNVISTVAVAVSTAYILRIQCVSSTQINFYINGAFMGSITTNLPTSTQLLGAYCGLDALAATAVSLGFSWFSSLMN